MLLSMVLFNFHITDKLHMDIIHGRLDRYVKLRVVHAPKIPGTFSLPPWVSDPDIHHGTCVPRCMPGSLTGGFL